VAPAYSRCKAGATVVMVTTSSATGLSPCKDHLHHGAVKGCQDTIMV
jgi:hypothetical protein